MVSVEVDLMIGSVGEDVPVSVLVNTVADLVGETFRPIVGSAGVIYEGERPDGWVWVKEERGDAGPFISHPYALDIRLREPEDELPLLEGVYRALVDSGNYKVILFVDDNCIRGSHFDCKDW
ncbi:hypothetical protein ACFOX0_33095 [Micromonospora zhanjiangensis]|uniref:Immunity protein 8 n=1 Tax=Micromonospora zhanjiangensis TaxID=1522057 RepID=A0ABV8KY11_9ACTN